MSVHRFALATTTAALLGLAAVSGAVAAAPQHDRIDIDDRFVAEGICPFPIDVHATGRILVTTTYGSDGRVTRISERPNISFTLSANGRTMTDRDVGLDKVEFAPDGTARILSTGIHVRLRSGSGKVVARRIGLQIIHLDANGDLVGIDVRGGRFDTDAQLDAALCDGLR